MNGEPDIIGIAERCDRLLGIHLILPADERSQALTKASSRLQNAPAVFLEREYLREVAILRCDAIKEALVLPASDIVNLAKAALYEDTTPRLTHPLAWTTPSCWQATGELVRTHGENAVYAVVGLSVGLMSIQDDSLAENGTSILDLCKPKLTREARKVHT